MLLLKRSSPLQRSTTSSHGRKGHRHSPQTLRDQPFISSLRALAF